MQFLYPQFLWALLALAIPIIIHLFYFRRFKKVYFTNVKFLKEIKEETSARRKLKNFLTLLMRLLAFVALILAFAQPFLPQETKVKKGEKAVSVYIDNSFSMSALSEDVPLMEKARQRAREIVEAYAVEDRFQIITSDFEGRHQRLVSKEDALTLIDEIKISPAVRELSKVLSRQIQALNTATTENKVSYIISDFQKNISDLTNFRDTTIELNLLPLQSVQEKNISLDSAWFEAPVQMINQTNTLLVKVKNHSDEAADNVRLTIKQDGQIKPVGTLSIPANTSVTDSINLTILRTGWQEAELSITDYPVQFDDKYYFTYNVAEEINILVINDGTTNKYLNSAFKGLGYFKINNQSANQIDYAGLSGNQLIILKDLKNISSGLGSELAQYVRNGGNLLVFPAAGASLDSYRSFLNNLQANELQTYEASPREVSVINTEEFIFQDVFENISRNIKLPVTQGNFKVSQFGSRQEERLLTYRDGGSYLGKYALEKGHLYLCAAPLNEGVNNLVRSGEIFIPMLYKMAISSAKDQRIAYTIGKDEVLETDNRITESEMVYKIKGKKEEFIPQQKAIGPSMVLGINNQIKDAGFYQLYLDAAKPLAFYGFNFDRRESELSYLNEDLLATQVGELANIIKSQSLASLTPLIGDRSRGVSFWRWCLIAALVFLLIETLLLRLWKV